MYCTKCGKQINDDGAFCPYCGNPRNGGNNNVSKEVKKEKKKINATIPIIIGLVITFFVVLIVVLGVIALFVGKTLDNGETTEESQTINSSAPAASSKMSVGDVVTLGDYEQDNNTSNGTEPIEWVVLDQNNGQYLLISKYVIDGQCWDNNASDNTVAANAEAEDRTGEITWEKCSVRSWLNGTFYDEAFSSDEKSHIVQYNYSNSNLYQCSGMNFPEGLTVGNGGPDTRDYVSLLSLDEYIKYYNPVAIDGMPLAVTVDDMVLNQYTAPLSMTSPTKYVRLNQKAYFESAYDYNSFGYGKYQSDQANQSYDDIDDDFKDNGYLSSWFLRTPGGAYTSGGFGGTDEVLIVWPNYNCLRSCGKTSETGIRPIIWVAY